MNPTGEESRHSAAEPLWRLVINESRLHSERTSFFLLANSFLLTAFALLRQEPGAGIQFVPLAVGMVFAFLHFININYGEKVMGLWQDLLRDESESGRAILTSRDDLFQKTCWLKGTWPGLLTRNVGSCLFPLLLFAMWAALMGLEGVKSMG
jgi:hypothetical protein